VGDDGTAGERRGLAEEDPEHHSLTVGIERVDGADDRRWWIGELAQAAAQGRHRRRARRLLVDDDGALGLRPGPPLLQRGDEELPRPGVAQRPDERRPGGGDTAGEDHLAPADELPQRPLPPVHARP
jgi:hypothetical protein